MKKVTKVKFEGIDSWNRPIFKDINSNRRYGSVVRLFPYNTTIYKIKEGIDENSLLYFGQDFDCEPEGTKPIKPLKIIWEM